MNPNLRPVADCHINWKMFLQLFLCSSTYFFSPCSVPASQLLPVSELYLQALFLALIITKCFQKG